MLHWKKSCYILSIWKQADNARMNLTHLATLYGWNVQEDGALAITEENIKLSEIGSLALQWDANVSGCATK